MCVFMLSVYVFLCVYVYVYICVSVCICACLCVWVCKYAYVCMYACIFVRESVSVNVYTLGLSDYHDGARYRDSLGLFTIVIVDCLTI